MLLALLLAVACAPAAPAGSPAGAGATGSAAAGPSGSPTAAAVDRSSLVLYGEKGLATFPDFRGKAIALTSPGAFGEIALHQTAREYGLVPGQDFELRYNTNSETALYTFLSGATAGAIVSP